MAIAEASDSRITTIFIRHLFSISNHLSTYLVFSTKSKLAWFNFCKFCRNIIYPTFWNIHNKINSFYLFSRNFNRISFLYTHVLL